MFGNRKRIEELQESIDLLCVRIRVLERISNRDFSHILKASAISPCKCPIDEETAEICFNCRIKTGETTVNHDTLGAAKTITTHYIPAASAIEKIMDHLGLEFDHIEATNPDTVIKPKETP